MLVDNIKAMCFNEVTDVHTKHCYILMMPVDRENIENVNDFYNYELSQKSIGELGDL
jgi:hypothetical protein